MKFLGFFYILLFLFTAPVSFAADKWPFDQRQILLANIDGQDFPDERTVARVMDIFVQRGRVRWTTRGEVQGTISPVKIPKDFAWYSPEAVKGLGLRYKVDGIVILSANGIEAQLRWYSVHDGLPMFFEEISLPEVHSDVEWKQLREERLSEWVHRVWNRIPGDGFVVERDGKTLSIEGAKQLGGQVGQKIDTFRILSVERHPALKTIIEVKTSDTGYAEILKVDTPLSKGEIKFEAEIDPVRSGDRYAISRKELDPTKVTPPSALSSAITPENAQEEAQQKDKDDRKRIFFFGNSKKMVDLAFFATNNPLSHSESISNVNYQMKSSSFSPGFDLETLVYFTKNWVIGANYSGVFANLKEVPAAYGVDSIDANLSSYSLYGAYRFLFIKNLVTPAELRVFSGYKSWGLSVSSIDNGLAPTSKTVSGLNIGLLVDFPLYGPVGAVFSGSRLFGTSLSETPLTSGDAPSPSFWNFSAGFHYDIDRFNQVLLRYSIETTTVNYDGQGSRASAATSMDMQRRSLGIGYSRAF